MGFFDFIGDMVEEHQEREWREEIYEEEEWEWGMEGRYWNPYEHGDLLFDPGLGRHGVMYNGMWHPLDYDNGSWVFVHPRRFGMPRNYRPGTLQPPQQSAYGGGYSPAPQPGYSQQPVPSRPAPSYQPAAAPQPASTTCPRCQAVQPAGTRFCQSCGTDILGQATARNIAYCTACGAALTVGTQYCGACGRAQV